jgi:hypothetical protein
MNDKFKAQLLDVLEDVAIGKIQPELALNAICFSILVIEKEVLSSDTGQGEAVGHLHSNGEFCLDRKMTSDVWPVSLYANPSQDARDAARYRYWRELGIGLPKDPCTTIREALDQYTDKAIRYAALSQDKGKDSLDHSASLPNTGNPAEGV